MKKTLALIGLGATLALAAPAAQAASGYGTQSYGYGPNIRHLTPFERSWNANNESKRQARAGADYMRRHHRSFPLPW